MNGRSGGINFPSGRSSPFPHPPSLILPRGPDVCFLYGVMLRPFCALVLGVACLAPLPPLPAQATRGKGPEDEIEAPEVKKLVFRGVKAVGKGELERSVSVEESKCRSMLLKVFCVFTKSSYFYQHEYLDRSEFQRDPLRVKVFY